MAKNAEIRMQLSRLLAKQISLSDFSKWFVPYAWNLDEGDEGFELAEAIDAELVQFDMDVPELRARLQEIHAASVQISVNVSIEICLADDEGRILAQPIIRSRGSLSPPLEVVLIPPRDLSLAEYVNGVRRSRTLQTTQPQPALLPLVCPPEGLAGILDSRKTRSSRLLHLENRCLES